MNWSLVSRLLAYLALLIGTAMVVSLPWSFPVFGEAPVFERATLRGMVWSIGICLAAGGVLAALGRQSSDDTLLRKEALAVVGLGWILCGVLGGLPYLLTPVYRMPGVPMTSADAFFESVSGFTTTGASVLSQLEVPEGIENCELAARRGEIGYIPRSVLFWRSFTHWLGGMGIIVLFVAILGQLGAGGKALMRREVPGPLSDNVRPRIRESAMLMWTIYLGLSALLAVTLMCQGMSVFDSLCHTFGTLATGGFSTRNSSVGAFASSGIETSIIVFMILAGTNFNLYYLLFHSSGRQKPGWAEFLQRMKQFVLDPEFRAYLAVILVSISVLAVLLHTTGVYQSTGATTRHAAFNVVAIMTTTGFGTENFAVWPAFAQSLLLLLMFVGGCSGSTGGGIKVIRFLVLWKVLKLEAERAFRPNLVQPIRLAGKRIDESIARDVVVYFCLLGLIFVASWGLLLALEPTSQWDGNSSEKLVDCGSAVAATLNNIGPGLGVCGPHGNYTHFTDAGKVLLTFLMLLGRLELFAIVVLLIPAFWKTQ